MTRLGDRGQASIELLAAVPLIVMMALALWQAALAVRSASLAATSARAAARADALGLDAAVAARRALPLPEAKRADVARGPDGSVRVAVQVPNALGGRSLGWIGSSARFGGQP